MLVFKFTEERDDKRLLCCEQCLSPTLRNPGSSGATCDCVYGLVHNAKVSTKHATTKMPFELQEFDREHRRLVSQVRSHHVVQP